MQKLHFIFFILPLLFGIQIVSANESCIIQGKASPGLSQYMKDTNTLLQNINTGIKESKQKANSSFMNESNNIINGISKLFEWDGYWTSASYYLVYPLSNNISQEVKRDHKRLLSISDNINKQITRVTKKGFGSIIINQNTACKNIENCTLSGKVEDILLDLYKNNGAVLELYRKSVMGEKWYTNNFQGNILLTDSKTFQNEIEDIYGNPKLNCLNEEKSFDTKSRFSMENIIKNLKGGNASVDTLKKSLDLLKGVDTKEEEKREKELLSRELARQGVNSDLSNNALESLDQGISWKNNFVTNTYTNIKRNLQDDWNSIKEDYFKKEKRSEKSYSQMIYEKKENDIDLEISQKISQIYNYQLPFTNKSNKNLYQLSELIKQNIKNLDESILTLQKTTPLSQAICNSHDSGNGKCD